MENRKKSAGRTAGKPASKAAPRKGAAPRGARAAKPGRRTAAAGGKGALGGETKVRRSGNVASRTIDGQEVIIVPSSRKLQLLNEVATRIWSLCDGRSVREIARAITGEYRVAAKRALEDVLEFVRQIHRKGMVDLT